MDRESIIRGLAARLEMDAGLGVEFMSETNAGLPQLDQTVAIQLSNIPTVHSRPRTSSPGASIIRDSAVSPYSGQHSGSHASNPVHERREHPGSPPPPSSSMEATSSSPSSSAGSARVSSRRIHVPVINVRNSLVPFVEPPSNPEKEAALADLREECMACEACGLCERRNSVVWGEGDLAAEVMFIGEGPGRDEDAEGRPFVGRSGRLLTDIIEKGMKVERSRVYIANVVKCRPPGNRDPYPEEVEACSRYLNRQIEVVGPKVIVAVGSVAGRTLLRTEAVGGLRGRWHEYSGTPLRVIYHPSYLLRMRRTEQDRSPADRKTWEDIQEVMRRLG